MDNMEQLAALLEGHDLVDELELGELYRELRRPLKARAKLAKVAEDDRKLCEMQLTLIEMVYITAQLGLITKGNFGGN